MSDDGRARSRQSLWTALQACLSLSIPSPERDALWFAVQEVVCTHGCTTAVPMGSLAPIQISPEHATDELITAMTWLVSHEGAARQLSDIELFITLRGVATRGASGSARAFQADALHGMTGVPPGQGLRWTPLDRSGAA